MWKRLSVVALILAVAVLGDLLYTAAAQTAGQTFDLRLSASLFWVRPIVLIAGYVLILIAGYSLIVAKQPGQLLSAMLIVVGLAVIYLTTFPPGSGYRSTRDLYQGLVAVSASRWGLTVHAGAFLVALGVIRLLPLSIRPRT